MVSIPKTQNSSFLVGVDEVGRGPLAGPLLVCAVAIPSTYDQTKLLGVGDSKTLKEEEREEWFHFAQYEQEKGNLSFAFGSISHSVIDGKGIAFALRLAVETALSTLALDQEKTKVFLDGSLYAPPGYVQETIIKGDALLPLISLASNIAKVTRDAHMKDMGKQYPEYGFEKHKGYGTKAHQEAIRTHGPCAIHRRSFLRL